MKNLWKNNKESIIIASGIVLTIVLVIIVLIIFTHFRDINSRSLLADAFYNQLNLNEDVIKKYKQGIDFGEDVSIITLQVGYSYIQYRTPLTPRGNFYGGSEETPDDLGISPIGKEGQKIVPKIRYWYRVIKPTIALKSYASSIHDTWSVPGKEFHIEGGGVQYFTNCQPCFEEW